MVSSIVDVFRSVDFIRDCSEAIDEIKGYAEGEHIVCRINGLWSRKKLAVREDFVWHKISLVGLENLFGYEIIWDSDTPENQIVFEGRYREL